MELIAKRADTAEEIGRVKAKDGLPTRDQVRERAVRASFAAHARSLGVGGEVAAGLADLLITSAVKTQSRKCSMPLTDKAALVVGGSGKMGAWTCRFLSCRGASVTVWDPRGPLRGYAATDSLDKAAGKSDIVVIASPLGAARRDMRAVLSASPEGLVFDICSVKTHLTKDLRRAAKAGFRVTSVHPMFGPRAESPKGRNVVVCGCGSGEADREAARLFASSGAVVTSISLEKHDKLMAYVLGLPHLCALMFAASAEKSKIPFAELTGVQGPSFERLARSAVELSTESRRVYHDVQLLNPGSRAMVSQMERALRELRSAALAEDPKAFRAIMDRCERYLEVS